MVKFGEIAREVRTVWKEMREGVPVVGLEHIVPGEMELKKYDLPEENTFTKKFCKGQVLFGRRRAYQKKATVATFDGICSGDITVIEPIPGMVVPELLPIIVANDRFFDHAIQGSAGSLSPRVKWEHMANYEFELPTLGEQKVLSNKLWAAYRLKEAYQRLLNATDEMEKSQFLEMFGNPQTCSSGVVGKDVFEFASGKALTKENLNPEYEYNCYGGNGVTGKSNDYLVEASTIVIGRVGEYCGGIHLTNPYSWITDNAIYLKKYDSRYELEFIEYLFKAMDFHRFASESGQPKITQSPLIESVYPLPSKDEQIAFLIIKRQADKSKFDGFKSQFLEMFGNAKRTPLVDVCLKSGEYGSNSPADDYDGNIRYVRITDITDEGNLNNLLVSPRKIEEKYLLVKDDLLFARTGNTVGKTYLHNEGKMVFAGYLIRYKLNKNIVLPQFAFAYTHTNDYYVWVEKTKKIGAQPNISATQYDEMPIPTPPLSEQKAFVSIAEQADKSKFELRKAISAIDEVIKSLING